MPAGDDGTVFRGNAFVDIQENGDILVSPESGQQVTFEGENFDGQGTTELQNLQSVGTERLHSTHYIASNDDAQAIADDAGPNSVLVFLDDMEVSLTINNDHVEITGMGDPTLTLPAQDQNIIEAVGQSHLKIHDLHLDGDRANNGNTQTASDGVGNNIYLEDCKHVRVSDSLTENAPSHGFFSYATTSGTSENITVKDVDTTNNWFRGLHSHGGVEKVRIEGLTSWDNHSGGLFVGFDADTDTVVTGCHLYDNHADSNTAAELEVNGKDEGDGSGERLIISNCTIEATDTQHGVAIVTGASNFAISDCSIYATGTVNAAISGKDVSNFRVTDCDIFCDTGNTDGAVRMESVSDAHIADCDIEVPDAVEMWGVWITGTSPFSNDITVTDCEITAVGRGGIGLWEGNEHCILTDNRIYADARNPIRLYDTNSNVCDNNIIKNNVCHTTQTDAVDYDDTASNIVKDNINAPA